MINYRQDLAITCFSGGNCRSNERRAAAALVQVQQKLLMLPNYYLNIKNLEASGFSPRPWVTAETAHENVEFRVLD